MFTTPSAAPSSKPFVLTISAGTWLAWSSFMFVVKIHY